MQHPHARAIALRQLLPQSNWIRPAVGQRDLEVGRLPSIGPVDPGREVGQKQGEGIAGAGAVEVG